MLPVLWYVVLGLFLAKIAVSQMSPTTKKTTLAPEGPCEQGWQYHNLYCYKAGDGPMEYFNAEFLCARENANLASIHSDGEREFVTTKVSKSSYHLVWIGFTKIDNIWKWTDESDATSYTKWDRELKQPARDDCAAINRERNYLWHDIDCDRQAPYVCKKAAMVSVFKCETGWQLYESSCYKAGDMNRKYFNAESVCAREEAHLTSIHSDGEREFVTSKVSKSSYHLVWIGFTKIGNKWEWTDESDATSYTKWDRELKQPARDNCAVINRERNYLWHDINCQREAPYVCEKPAMKIVPGTAQ